MKAKLVHKSQLSISDASKAYRDLRQTVIKEGILKRAYGYYAIHFTLATVGFAACIYGIVNSPHPVITALLSVFFGIIAVQFAGFIHDAGHRSIFKSVWANDVFGLMCSVPVAMGYSFWKYKHNAHHAHTNEEDGDPDLDLPILSFTKERFNEKRGLERAFAKFQPYLYFPIGVLVFFSVRTSSISYFINKFRLQLIPELFLFTTGLYFWIAWPFLLLDWQKALIVTIVTNITSGFYLLNIFAPNHKGMPHIAKGTKISFLEQQVMTSRNIQGNWFVDLLYMGLNYQMEHHLFPDCPRNKLKYIVPHLRKVCKRLKIDYTVVNVLDQNKIIIGELAAIARSVK